MSKNIIIGIVTRDEDISGKKFMGITKNNFKYLDGKCSYIGIINYNDDIDYNVLDLCDGIIIPGGDKIYDYHYKIIEYAIKNNIPLLGICMGCQAIGLYSVYGCEDDLIRVNNHYNLENMHIINTKEDTLINKLLGDIVYVNSRHLYRLEEVSDDYIISSYSNDNVIESIEYIDDNHFILGVQWHPEDMDNMDCLYDYFLKEVIIRKK